MPADANPFRMLSHKTCRSCNVEKPLEAFARDRRRKDGRHSYCLACKARDQRSRGQEATRAKQAAPERFCTRCSESRPSSEFAGKRGYVCASCKAASKAERNRRRSAADRHRYDSDPEWRRSRAERLTHLRKERKRRLVEMTGGCCADCGISPGDDWPIEVFDFHHEAAKDETMTRLLASNRLWTKAVAEAQKCVVLCSNCHRRRHAREESQDGT